MKESISNLKAAKAALGILYVILNNASDEAEEKPFNGIRQVSKDHLETDTFIPTDGTAVEMKIPEGFEVFISEDGKPMIRKRVEAEGEPAKSEDSSLTYEDIAKKLYKDNQTVFYYDNDDKINTFECNASYNELDNSLSEAQVKRWLAFNKLQNIALYLNNGWMPNFLSNSKKYFIWECGATGRYTVGYNTNFNEGSVYFRTEELAEQAIRIMGEESLSDLFNTNW